MIDSQFRFPPTNLRLQYNAGKYADGREWPSVDEYRPLNLLNADLPTLFWYTGNSDQIPPPERSRPLQEIRMANLLQALATRDPWKEEWVSFWRDHLSVYGEDGTVRSFLPHWERTVLREYCWGNFEQMLNASAKHACMQYYLNNEASRAGGANENYARELFELHTLGRSAYLNNLYANWKKVPGAPEGAPIGYIDEDVYEAARAFTGWTLEHGAGMGGGQSRPKTGRFMYIESLHDNYQKRVLAKEFSPYAGPMRDGQAVLNLCASHPATARHLASKMVKRMLGDSAPQSIVKSTAQVFYQQRNSPEQLTLVYEHLVREGQSVAASQKQKVKSPTRLAASFCNAINLEPMLEEGRLLGPINEAAPPIYGWRTPEGPPDDLALHFSSAYLRGRLQLVQGIAENWWGTGDWNPFTQLPAKRTYGQLLERWEVPLFGSARPDLRASLLASQNTNPNDLAIDIKRACRLVGLLACAPSFQTEVVLASPAQWSAASGRLLGPNAKTKTAA